jgi:RNA polymerase sigma factor (sigma-70 family)
MENLTEKVIAFQRSNGGLEELVTALAPRIYSYPRHKLGLDEDACGDFYVYFQPRLLRLLARFKDQGKPFESYLCSVLSWQLKNFARERRRSERGWKAALRLEAADQAGQCAEPEEEPETGPSTPGFPDEAELRLRGLLERECDRRNLLLLALKCLHSLTPERVGALCSLTGLSEDRLAGYVSSLRACTEPRQRRLRVFRERRNRAFSQARLLEAEISEETDPARRECLRARLARTRRRMRTAIQRMSRVLVNPTNREIAEVMGIPKGTVDSGLYWLKRKLAPVYDPDSRRLA